MGIRGQLFSSHPCPSTPNNIHSCIRGYSFLFIRDHPLQNIHPCIRGYSFLPIRAHPLQTFIRASVANISSSSSVPIPSTNIYSCIRGQLFSSHPCPSTPNIHPCIRGYPFLPIRDHPLKNIHPWPTSSSYPWQIHN